MIEAVLLPPVEAAEAFADSPETVLFPEELAVVVTASERRKREFITARGCAHAALARLGLPPAAILPDRGGAPVWPQGVVGSITHCSGYRAAAVAPAEQVAAVGIDAEPNTPLRTGGMLDVIAREQERARLTELAGQVPGVCWDKLLFSAKEAVYKAWYPLARCWLGFQSADVVFDPHRGTFTARLLVPGPQVGGSPLTTLDGRWLASSGLLMAAIVIPGTAAR
jgi:4'-phosphopantetheinyl transferase EntD